MSLTPGTRVGPYEVTLLLGAGGMGEVYRARDVKLGRDVALKVLPEALADDPERLARFEREARVLASLNHPNIAAIYGLEQSADLQAIVLELVDGLTLDARLEQGALPLDEALRLAERLVDALEAAHASGIVHRDLKPANIKLRADGTLKVLDFGLAKAIEPAAGSTGGIADAATTRVATTRQGVVLGTPAYMSPEQASGKAVDRRADIWAFGCVLFEMITGRRAFEGRDVSDTLRAVLAAEPDWTALPPRTPSSLRRLLRRTLVKEREHRLADIGDARLEIADAHVEEPEPTARDAAGRTRWVERLAWGATVAILSVAAVAGWLGGGQPSSPSEELLLDAAVPPTADPTSLAISPDGRKIVFAAASNGRSQLWLRTLDSESAQPLRGTDNARLPFWSPDSRSIAFGADAELKRLDLDDGTVRRLAQAPVFLGGTWGSGDDILFVSDVRRAVVRIPASPAPGDVAVAVTTIGPGQNGHFSPFLLPDGRRFLYVAAGEPGTKGVYVGQLGTTDSRRLFDADSGAEYLPPGYLVFTRGGSALAQPIDLERLDLTGDPVVLARDVATSSFAVAVTAAVSVSAAGPIAYRTGSTTPQPVRMVWVDRTGREISPVAEDVRGVLNPALSPDERRVALFRNADIYMLDTADGALNRFTTAPGTDFAAVWSRGGSRLAIASDRFGLYDLFERAASGAGGEELLLKTDQSKTATDWSPDESYLLFRSFDPVRSFDVWGLDLKERRPFPLVQSQADERDAQFSRDGRWIAYQSNESGHFEIWVQPFSTPESPRVGRWQVSTTGGAHVRWNPDGRELFYVAPDGRLMALPIRVTSDGAAIEHGVSQPLFTIPGFDFARQGAALPPYNVSRDGRRFLIFSTPGLTNTSPIRIRFNWNHRP